MEFALSASRGCAAHSSQRSESGYDRLQSDLSWLHYARNIRSYVLGLSFLLVFALPSVWPLPAKQPELVFRDSTPGADDIAFNIPLPPEESAGPVGPQSTQLADLSNKSYVLVIGSDYSFPPNDNKEFFTAYLRAPGADRWLAYSVAATIPTAFSDKELTVSVTVKGVSVPVTGRVSIKFHNNSVPPFSVDPSNTGELDFTKTNIPTVLLKNDGKSFPVSITNVQVIRSKCPNCWRPGSQESSVSISPGHSEEISIPEKANTFYAIYESLLNFAPANPANEADDNEDDNIELAVSYTVLGTEQTAPIDAPVHFVPSIAHLIIAVLIGGLLGYGFARLIEPDKFTFPLRALGVAVGTAFIVEIVAVLLKTKLEIFGAELDPKRFLPAFLIALLVAGGPKVSELIKTGIDRLRGA